MLHKKLLCNEKCFFTLLWNLKWTTYYPSCFSYLDLFLVFNSEFCILLLNWIFLKNQELYWFAEIESAKWRQYVFKKIAMKTNIQLLIARKFLFSWEVCIFGVLCVSAICVYCIRYERMLIAKKVVENFMENIVC